MFKKRDFELRPLSQGQK